MIKSIKKSLIYALMPLLLAAPAQAGYEQASLRYDIVKPKKMGLQYDVYAGGFKALNAELLLDLDKQAYDMELKAQTQGFIGNLFPWKGDYSTSGHAEKGTLVPSLHTASSTWRNKESVTEMNYGPTGRLLKTTVQNGGTTTIDRHIDSSLAKDSVDMLTSALMMLQNTKNTSQCKGSFPVFDGKRRFNITLKDSGTELLPRSKYSMFSGEALRCTLKVEPVAGFKANDQKRGWMLVQNHTEEHHKLPTIWLARIDKTGPIVPVRMEIASEYGSVVAHLSGTIPQ
jgi:hypothetical protein